MTKSFALKRAMIVMLIATLKLGPLTAAPSGPLDPRGTVHIPIGVADSLDTLKTFVEAEGNFSPGFGSYGIYFWVWDDGEKRLYAPTMEDVKCEHGLGGNG